MKKSIVFILGMGAGACLTALILFLFIQVKANTSEAVQPAEEEIEPPIDEESYIPTPVFEEPPGEIINEKSFKVMQTQYLNCALVHGKDEYGYYGGMLYYLDGKGLDITLYDDQIVKVPKGKVVRMFGVYRYTTVNGSLKTVPRIRFVDK